MFYASRPLIIIVVFVAFIIYLATFRDLAVIRNWNHPRIVSIVCSVITTVMLIGFIFLCCIYEQQVFSKASIATVVEESKIDNPYSEAQYTYKFTSTKNQIYEIKTDKKINFKRYTVKVPNNSPYSSNIYLFSKNNDCIGTYKIVNISSKKIREH